MPSFRVTAHMITEDQNAELEKEAAQGSTAAIEPLTQRTRALERADFNQAVLSP